MREGWPTRAGGGCVYPVTGDSQPAALCVEKTVYLKRTYATWRPWRAGRDIPPRLEEHAGRWLVLRAIEGRTVGMLGNYSFVLFCGP